MLAFVFPGQGSQEKGMGSELFDTVPQFVEAEQQINKILGYSLREICLNNPKNCLSQTQFTQPCLYTINALHTYKAFAEGKKPQILAGHSLGEYNALLAAGAFDFITGLKLVKKRGELMSQATDGAMAAVLGVDPDAIRRVFDKNNLTALDIANYNSPTQTVISGPRNDIDAASTIFDAEGAMYIPLPVSAAFHSRYMLKAAQAFDEYLSQFTFNQLKIPVVANVTADLYSSANPTTTIRNLLVKQISESVQWLQSIKYLNTVGVSEYLEIGPGAVLSKLIAQIK
jgi:malonyl CoA-acyl carrier protein transacylase